MQENNLSYINGYLDAFSHLNNFCNHGADFIITCLEYQDKDTLGENIARFFPRSYQIKHEIMNNWEEEIKKTLDIYFYEFLDDSKNKVNSQNIIWDEEKFIRENTCDRFIFLLNSILQDLEKVYYLEINPSGEFYELYYNDYIFHTKTNIYFLHFGVSD